MMSSVDNPGAEKKVEQPVKQNISWDYNTSVPQGPPCQGQPRDDVNKEDKGNQDPKSAATAMLVLLPQTQLPRIP